MVTKQDTPEQSIGQKKNQKGKLKNIIKQMKTKTCIRKLRGWRNSSSEKKVYSNKHMY